MERRDRQERTSMKPPPTRPRAGTPVPLGIMRLKLAAKSDVTKRFENLMCHLKVENLRSAYLSLDPRKAKGSDGITKARYGENLEANLMDLETRLHSGSYHPRPARQILIPKGNDKFRPIAVSNFEDKIIQKAMADILGALYEPLFLHISLGFRPRQGCHSAIRKSYHLLKEGQRSYVVDVDLEKFFNSIDHDKLMQCIQRRISDPRFLRLLTKLLRVGILDQGVVVKNELGSPQGSIVSPILANIYLHYVLDLWFQKRFAKHDQQMVRYADDAIFCFQTQAKAKDFLSSLKGRLEEYKLKLNEDKTRIVNFRQQDHQVFNFLSFTFYWGRDRKGKTLLKLKTQAEKLRASIHEFKLWIKQNRSRYRTQVLWKKTAEKLRGHYAYYGVVFNSKVTSFYYFSTKLLFKWLNRRSQKKSMDWPKFLRRLRHHPLPKPWGYQLAKLNQGVFHYAI